MTLVDDGVEAPGRTWRERIDRSTALVLVGMVLFVVVAAAWHQLSTNPLLSTYQGEYSSFIPGAARAQFVGTSVGAASSAQTIEEAIWTEPKGQYHLVITFSVTNDSSHDVTLTGLGTGLAHSRAYEHTTSSASPNGEGRPFVATTLGAGKTRTFVLDQTRACIASSSPEAKGAGSITTSSGTTVTLAGAESVPVTYRYFGLSHTVSVPIQPYAIQLRASCAPVS